MDFEEKVAGIIEQIKDAEAQGSYDSVNQTLLEKRLCWYEQNKDRLNLTGSDVRKAYTLVLLEYMHIIPNDIEIIHEDTKKITWVSYNSCPVLEACIRLGVDTRKVCKEGWEKSVQAMIEKINPNLKFSRNYAKLRPHGQYCEESIELLVSI